MTAHAETREAVLREVRAFAPFVSARVDDEWITLAARLPHAFAPLSPWDALLLAGCITGPAKLVLPPGGREFEIRAEIPGEDEVDVAACVRQACDGMRALAAGVAAGAIGPAATAQRPAGASEEAVPCASALAGHELPGGELDLPSLAAEAGWPFVLRSSRRLAVDLEVPGQFQQAIVEPSGAGCRARAALAAASSPSARSRTAVGALLLTVAGLVRLVRGGAIEREGEATVFVEADFSGGLAAAELHHALSALAVACRLAGREAKALMDEEVARAYLAGGPHRHDNQLDQRRRTWTPQNVPPSADSK